MQVNKKPRFQCDVASRILRSEFGVVPESISELSSERDQNFEIRDRNGTGYVLKISHPEESFGVLDFQNKVLLHLGEMNPSPIYPRVVTGRKGGIFSVEEGGTRHWIRLLSFMEGVPLGEARPPSLELWSELGGRLAELDRSLASFEHQEMDRELYWDSRHASGTIEANYEFVKPEGDKLVLLSFAERFANLLDRFSGELRRSVIHNDANDLNLLVDEKLVPKEIVGIIDFGDIVRTFTICEVANAAAYAMMNQGDPIEVARFLIQGYHSIYRLTDLEFELLFDFIAIRLCLSVSNAARQKSLAPDNLYLTVSERPAWDLLRQFADLKKSDFIDRVSR